MTIGDKIKYCRIRLGITQSELANLSGIHPVSIRKYETNKMTPQPGQLSRIAEAMGISPMALLGVRDSGLQLETIGDLYGVLMSLIEANILCLNGDRQTSLRLTTDNYEMFLNPHLNSFLEFETEDHRTIPLDQIKVRIKDPEILKKLLSWDGIRAACYYAMKQNNDQPTEEVMGWWHQKELSELDMQLDSILLDSSHGTKARIPHKIENQKK